MTEMKGVKMKDIYTMYDVVICTSREERRTNETDAKEAARQLRMLAVVDAIEEEERKRRREKQEEENGGESKRKITVAIVVDGIRDERNAGNTQCAIAENFEAEMKAMGIDRVRTVITSHPLVRLSAVKAHTSTTAMPASLARGGVHLSSFVAAMKERELELFSTKARAEKPLIEVTVIRSRCGGGARVTRMTAKERKSFVRHMTSTASSEHHDDLEQNGLGLKITLRDGSMFFAKSAVLEAGENQPVVPSWVARGVRDAVVRYGAPPPSDSIRHASSPCSLAHSGDGDHVIRSRKGERTLVVIGGGETAAVTAIRAAEGGSGGGDFQSVVLVHRRQLVTRDLSLDSAWMGLKNMKQYNEVNDYEKLRLLRSARVGTVTPRSMRRLRRLQSRGILRIIEDAEVSHAVYSDAHHNVSEITSSQASMWLLTLVGSRNKDRIYRTGDDARDMEVERDAMPSFSHARADDMHTTDHGDPRSMTIAAESIVLATGRVFSLASSPLLSAITDASSSERPRVEARGGYPCLSEELCVQGAPLYVIGAAASMQMGPGSGTCFSCDRDAAARIACSIVRHVVPRKGGPDVDGPWLSHRGGGGDLLDMLDDDDDHDDDDDGVVAAIENLDADCVPFDVDDGTGGLARVAAMMSSTRIGTGTPTHATEEAKDASGGGDDDDSGDGDIDSEKENGSVHAVAESARPPQRSIEITEYSWCEKDRGFTVEICIEVPLSSVIDSANVRVNFAPRSLDVAIPTTCAGSNGSSQRSSSSSIEWYHMSITKLFREVDVKKSFFKVSNVMGRVKIFLSKKESMPWRFLKA